VAGVSILSAQSIRKACVPAADGILRARTLWLRQPLLSPFVEKGIINGRSFGLSACTYDVRTKEDILLSVGEGCLAVTLERFCIPTNICGSVLDKSTHARAFVTAFNTHLDPGWEGFLTVELVNLGTDIIRWAAGDPLCQIKFEWLDELTELPYHGKYQDQPAQPVSARYETNPR
jgi:dCTP deaminase